MDRLPLPCRHSQPHLSAVALGDWGVPRRWLTLTRLEPRKKTKTSKHRPDLLRTVMEQLTAERTPNQLFGWTTETDKSRVNTCVSGVAIHWVPPPETVA